MSHFYGTLRGARGLATRCGTAKSGVTTVAASWSGAIEVHVFVDKDGRDCFDVRQILWHGHGVYESLASGVIGQPVKRAERQPSLKPLSERKATGE